MSIVRMLAVGLGIFLPIARLAAQTTQKSMIGDYYLQGVREVGSGFRLNADSTFEFFFSYGALDRLGKGTWKRQGEHIVLNSKARPPKDFALVTSRTVPGNKLTIRIIDPNTQLLRYVECSIKSGANVSQESTNEKGEAYFPKHSVDAISLIFQLCPDRYSAFEIPDKTHNYFEFRFEPWIADVFFENTTYTIVGADLSGPHPLLEPGKTYEFVRE